ncbi:PQQ-binding-like beta-propeller repeat protein [Streptomyces sp. NPDC015127]|uniref:outer membrane protein assembly factor BamB family protein n=1 Tax=Streptomyces sp. NPDC015127 TaxID=3364939 RepID=UPI0036FB0A23
MADDIPQLTVRAHEGSRLWTLRAPAGTMFGPVVAGGSVHVPLAEGRIVALDAHSGGLLWCSRPLTDPDPQALARADGAVVVPVRRDAERCGFTALDPASGEVLWERRKSPLVRLAAAGPTVVLWGEAGEDRGRIAGVDARTGETLWEDEFSRIWDLLVCGPRVVLDVGDLRALDARTGEELWTQESAGFGALLRPEAPSDSVVFHCWSSHAVLSVRATGTGEEISRTRFPRRTVERLTYDPALVDGERALFSAPLKRRIRLYAYAGRDRAEPLASPSLGWWRFTSLSERAVCAGDRLYALTWRRRLYQAGTNGTNGGRHLMQPVGLTAPDGRTLREPSVLAAGPEHAFVGGDGAVAGVRDGEVRWVVPTNLWRGTPVPLGTDRVLFRSVTEDGRWAGLHCADADTGRRHH